MIAKAALVVVQVAVLAKVALVEIVAHVVMMATRNQDGNSGVAQNKKITE